MIMEPSPVHHPVSVPKNAIFNRIMYGYPNSSNAIAVDYYFWVQRKGHYLGRVVISSIAGVDVHISGYVPSDSDEAIDTLAGNCALQWIGELPNDNEYRV